MRRTCGVHCSTTFPNTRGAAKCLSQRRFVFEDDEEVMRFWPIFRLALQDIK